jgi:hypothetical protein
MMKITRTADIPDDSTDPESGTSVTILSTEAYLFLKKVTTIILPALASLYFGLAAIWDLPAAEQVVGTIALITTFLGVTLSLSSSRYNHSTLAHQGNIVVNEDEGGVSGYVLELNGDPELLRDHESVTFKVKRPGE